MRTHRTYHMIAVIVKNEARFAKFVAADSKEKGLSKKNRKKIGSSVRFGKEMGVWYICVQDADGMETDIEYDEVFVIGKRFTASMVKAMKAIKTTESCTQWVFHV